MTTNVTLFSNNSVRAIALCNSFKSLPELNDLLSKSRSVRYRDAVRAEIQGGEAWVFDYGVVVFWGVGDNERQAFVRQLETVADEVLVHHQVDDFEFVLDSESHRIHEDTLYLQGHDVLPRLAASHALAQSVKLAQFECKAQETIVETAHIPRSLAKTGRMSLSRKQTAKIRGSLFGTKSDILLNFGLLDVPEFFWEYPELESLYSMVERYLDVNQRVTLLSKKLETIHELFEMLADEQKHQHSSTLEWIIIILIAIEIVLFFVH